MLRYLNRLAELDRVAAARPPPHAHPSRNRHDGCDGPPMEVDDPRCEFPDGRLSLPPDLSFREDRDHVALKESGGAACADGVAHPQELTEEPRDILARHDNGSVADALHHVRSS